MDKAFEKVVIVGAGTMGLQIGQQVASYQVPVMLVDRNASLVENILLQQDSEFLDATTEFDKALSDCDLVIESITENLHLKQNFFKNLEVHISDTVVLTTNSSMLLPSKIGRKLEHKERFCGFHFYAPAMSANIVDVSPIQQTNPAVAERLCNFASQTGFEPVLIQKENRGYVYNDILDGINSRAIGLVIKGVASIEDVDKSFRINTRAPLGPFQMMDIVGLDVVLHIVKNKARRQPKSLLAVPFLNRYVKAGKLGVKTGEGFYKYGNQDKQENP
ncbi:MAG: 3-hydroxyacyl-CoA dehydrogenase NAD-binding domain-containing protein [Anaerolineae bacterium]|jgi:3-hydroxybutyryl-CoA dehydrogenase|nr:3-hydroxyacyl-CoA dehydrogenase NAD-binding domain-containing protein [Anaerolineae bacterium]